MTHLLSHPMLGAGALLASTAALAAAPPPPAPPPLAPVYMGSSPASQPMASTEAVDWWHTFDDPVLSVLVEQALSQNIDLRVSVARVGAARAMQKGAKAAGKPEIDLGGDVGRQRASAYGIGYTKTYESNAFEADLSASWELELFGRVRSGVTAAKADLAAAQQDSQNARLLVANETARTYLAVRGYDRRLAILRDQQRAQSETAGYTKRMFDAGAAPRGDLDRAEAQAASTTADVPAMELQREQQVLRLSVLLATTPQDIAKTLGEAGTATSPQDPPAGVPADLLRRRPDIAAAEARVLAAYGRLGVAEADLKPQFRLDGMIGALASAFTGVGLGRSLEWLAQASGSAPLFDGGRRRSVIQQRQAEADEARLHYQATVLGAVQEVEGALASLARDRERSAALRMSATSARNAADQVKASWQAGQTPILDVLEADRTRLAADDSLAQSQTEILRGQVQLYTSLGD